MVVKIEFKDTEVRFKDDMTLDYFDYIKLKFAINNGAPKLSRPNWWYEKSDFSLYVLKKLSLNYNIGYELIIETKEEWRMFYPVFKHYFPTLKEYNGIKNNVAFWHGRNDRVLEDSFYIKWVVLNKYGLLNYGELKKMPFKEAMMLYYYAMIDNMFEKADNFAKTAYDEMRKDMDKSTEEIYR